MGFIQLDVIGFPVPDGPGNCYRYCVVLSHVSYIAAPDFAGPPSFFASPHAAVKHEALYHNNYNKKILSCGICSAGCLH